MRKIAAFFCLLAFFFLALPVEAAGESNIVIITELSGEIDPGQAALALRGLQLAETRGARAFVLQIDTFGGLVAAATMIRDKVIDSPVTTVCYVKNRAWSAGALIALAHRKIVMAPGGSIGAAEPIPTTEKTIAAVKAEFAATAAKRGRDVHAAEAMVDKTLGYKNYAQKGQILAFTDYQAVEAGYADFIAADRGELLRRLGLEGARIETVSKSWQEELISLLSIPAVKSALLTIIILGVITEIKTAGLGLGAFFAILGAALLYGANFLAGSVSWLEPLLFVLGLVLVGIELFIPGFGIFGIGGIISMIASFFLVLGGDTSAIAWLAGSIVAACILFMLILRWLPESRLWRGFVLRNTSSREAGYSTGPDYTALMGKTGVTLTPLRPGGSAEIEGERLDVLSLGEFIQPGEPVVVIKTEGSTVFVKKQ
jgi:membrane-bound serine protease (ClpP class)